MKPIYQTINTDLGPQIFRKDIESGVLSTMKELPKNTVPQFVVSDDPSNYTTGTVFNDMEIAKQHQEDIKIKTYIFELHYVNLESENLPMAIFVHDGEKRIRIL